MKNLKLILTVSVIVVLAIIIFAMYVNYTNKNERLKEKIHALQTSNKAGFDEMFKTIQSVAKVSDEYKEAFKEIYPSLIEGRYKNDGNNLMKWIQESNPNFDTKLYSKLIDVIESKRSDFFKQQQKLIDVNREQRTMLKTIPSKWFLNESDTIHIIVITSRYTENTFQSGEENDYMPKF